MKPYLAKFFIYADDQSQIDVLQRTLHDLVTTLYRDGVYVSAQTVTRLLNNPMTKTLLK